MNESFPTATGNSNIFNDNLHSFSIACNRGIPILNYYLFLEGKQLSSRFSLEGFLFLEQRPRKIIAPVGGYSTKIGVFRKAQLQLLKSFSRSTKILNVTTLPFLIAGNFPVLKNYFSAVYHSFGKYQEKCTANWIKRSKALITSQVYLEL